MPPAAHERVTGTHIEPLSAIVPEVPPPIEAAVHKALELNVNLRQQSVMEFAQALGSVPTEGTPTMVLDRTGRSGREVPSVRPALHSIPIPSIPQESPVFPAKPGGLSAPPA